MRIVHFEKAGVPGIAADDGSGWHGLTGRESGFPGTLPELIARGADLLRTGRDLLPMHAIDLNAVRILPPIPKPPKIVCVGLNYDDHLAESGLKKPVYPEIFARFATSLIAHHEPIRRPPESSALDYEAELAVVIGRRGRRIQPDRALDHVAGYSLFNDATIRDYQLRIQGRLNGNVMQDANTDQLIFGVAALIEMISVAMSLEPGDVIITGTPGGVGVARKPPVFMHAGDVFEVEIEGMGALSNPVQEG